MKSKSPSGFIIYEYGNLFFSQILTKGKSSPGISGGRKEGVCDTKTAFNKRIKT